MCEIVVEADRDRVAAAVAIAAEVHAGQVDKGGAPYILHPLAVLSDLREHDVENPYELEALRCAAVLHDAIEDAPADRRREIRQRIYDECGNRCSQAVDVLTRQIGDEYLGDYIERITRDWIARRVKMADLIHNLDESRLGDDAQPATRMLRYRKALELIREAEDTAGASA